MRFGMPLVVICGFDTFLCARKLDRKMYGICLPRSVQPSLTQTLMFDFLSGELALLLLLPWGMFRPICYLVRSRYVEMNRRTGKTRNAASYEGHTVTD